MKKEMIKPFIWGVVVGAVVLLIVIFATGWVTTSSSAQEMAEEKAEKAVTQRLASICEYQFKQDPKKSEKLEELKQEDSWSQGDYVAEQGWATMPDKDEPNSDVADACAISILEEQKED